MLVLHQKHNLFHDPMAIPLFLSVSLFLNLAKKVAMKVADRLKIWMVEGEFEHVEVYDEGPGSRAAGALPPGMAAVDATLAECIEVRARHIAAYAATRHGTCAHSHL